MYITDYRIFFRSFLLSPKVWVGQQSNQSNVANIHQQLMINKLTVFPIDKWVTTYKWLKQGQLASVTVHTKIKTIILHIYAGIIITPLYSEVVNNCNKVNKANPLYASYLQINICLLQCAFQPNISKLSYPKIAAHNHSGIRLKKIQKSRIDSTFHPSFELYRLFKDSGISGTFELKLQLDLMAIRS